ncbi:hypothetical protein [Coleofasciculus sp. F4-SAH-05]|uniref:hypothetical protein n=1 Tax=Coleofasciculus sp. F4-SAH-05 TaxID=3069525 RepID=UPI0032F96F50
MFRRFTTPSDGLTLRDKAEMLFRLHPSELSALLEMAWDFRVWEANEPLGHPRRRSDIPGLPEYLLNTLFSSAPTRTGLPNFFIGNQQRFGIPASVPPRNGVMWDHLIYAYLIENTRIYDIFRKVIHEYRHGEKLGVPLASSQHWLRNTEELFFRDAAPFSIYSVGSYIRPDSGASRRNAYYRMFGMDLNHGMENGQPYPYVKPDTANREFVNTWEEFLREVWVAISNQNNTSGTNPQDDAAILDLAKRLHDMLRTRRTNGNLSREEFWYVSVMSWFHLAVEFDTPIVVSLRAEGASEEERLKKIAERVNLPPHGKSFYFFLLADRMSWILTQLETGIYLNELAIPAFYTVGSPVERVMRSIITYWSQATGRNMKEKARSVSISN